MRLSFCTTNPPKCEVYRHDIIWNIIRLNYYDYINYTLCIDINIVNTVFSDFFKFCHKSPHQAN